MENYYTNVAAVGNNILYRGIKNGRRVQTKIEYSPTLFLTSKTNTGYRTLHGENLEPKKFSNLREARDFIRRYEEVSNFTVYGNSRFEYAFIAETNPGMVEWELKDLSVAVVDIEVGSENGFPDPYEANEPITAITIKYLNGETFVFGCGDYVPVGDESYTKCSDEYDLCEKFLIQWVHKCPDVISGWNVKFFDVPYLYNRFRKLLGEKEAKKLSPWGIINERTTNAMNKELIAYTLIGVSVLDYLELYQWYAPDGKSQENYRLHTIAMAELGEGKITYDDYENLHDLYKKNFQLYVEYNVKDVDLIIQLDDKLKLFELALTLAYDTKSNFDDVFAQTRMWDSLTYNYLIERKIVVPPRVIQKKDTAFEGAYVKEVQVGAHDWVASFDLNSLYPHLIMQYNISPETLLEPYQYTDEMKKIVSEGVSVEKLLEKEIDLSKIKNATITPNAQFFRTDFRGFLPSMMEEMYNGRTHFKKLMLKAEQEYEDEPDELKRYEIQKRISRYNNLQLAKKLSLNSAYGALGSQYFRFYDLRMALGVTQSGKLSIKWIESKLNGYMNSVMKTEQDYVIASDTDSIYLKLGPLVHKVYGVDGSIKLPKAKIIEFMDTVCEQKIQPFINKSFQELADYMKASEQKMRMKREALADRGIWTAKKRYILNVFNNEGVQYKEPKVKVKGLEVIKSSTPSVVRSKMREAISIMLNGKEEEMHQFIREFREEFKDLPVEDISFPRGVNGLSTYADGLNLYKKGTPIHTKGAIIYNHYLKQKDLSNRYPLIQEGEKIKFTYLKSPNPFKDMVISFPGRLPKEFGIQEYIDYDTQFEKTFVEPISTILSCMGWHVKKQNNLESFFG